MVTRRSSPPLRQVAARSAALLRQVTDPARVLAWLCPACGQWVPPRRFCLDAGVCRSCARLHDQDGT